MYKSTCQSIYRLQIFLSAVISDMHPTLPSHQLTHNPNFMLHRDPTGTPGELTVLHRPPSWLKRSSGEGSWEGEEEGRRGIVREEKERGEG